LAGFVAATLGPSHIRTIIIDLDTANAKISRAPFINVHITTKTTNHVHYAWSSKYLSWQGNSMYERRLSVPSLNTLASSLSFLPPAAQNHGAYMGDT
jgi:hypothetical protein